MIYQFKSKMVKKLNAQQKEFVEYKREKYSFKNKSRIEPYKIAMAIDTAEQSSVKQAIKFAGLERLMD